MRYICKNPSLQQEMLEAYEKYGLHPYIAKILYYRGIMPENVLSFFYPAKETLLDPFLFSNMARIVERLQVAVRKNEKVTVYGDYDCDGICGAAILFFALKYIGITPELYLPDRFTEGYGTNREAFRRIFAAGTALIVTVDCGIKSVEDVAFARENGVDVIILDHHESSVLPDTPYILNPKVLTEAYPFKKLSGAGVAFKVAQALMDKEAALSLLDIAGVATIGDMVGLTGENRAIAALGIQKLRKAPAVGLQCLAKAAGIDIGRIDSAKIGYGLVPRLNVAGRLARADMALRLLLSQDTEECIKIATELNQLNASRQALQKKITAEAVEMIRGASNLSKSRIVIACSEEWNKGVVGLAATSLASSFYRPAVVFAEEDGVLIGSARSIPSVNLYQALVRCEDKYVRFGGHGMAAGISIKKENLPAVETELNRFLLENYKDEDFLPTIYYDIAAEGKQMNLEFAEQVAMLEPFGQENEEPVLLLEGFSPSKVVKMGGGAHLRLHSGDTNAVWFGATSGVSVGRRYILSAGLSVNEYKGKRDCQLVVRTMEEQPLNAAEIAADGEVEYIRVFPKELLAFYDFIKKEKEDRIILTREDLIEKLRADMEKSLFGTAVFVNSRPGVEISAILKQLGMVGRYLEVPALPTDSAENILCYTLPQSKPGNYSSFYLLGCFCMAEKWEEAFVYLGEDLKAAYKKEALCYFVEEEALQLYLAAFEKVGKKGFSTVSELLGAVSAITEDRDIRRPWFAFSVFAECGLIQIKKNDNIYIICNEFVKKWERSRFYIAFRAVCCQEG